ncbi:MAG: hypothetical protein K9N05_02305 [Candidatus Marinimicrobia bacterium]|nr:hypothetical protein [Candidatus Neomarinimicrobiota bacterium]
MKRSLVFLLIIGLMMISCVIKPNDPPELNNEEHAVISAVLDSLIHLHLSGTIDVYDQTSTSINSSSLSIIFQRDSIGSGSLLDIYNEANRTGYSLNMDKLPNYVVLKDTEESEPYSGYTHFTRPGISDDGLMAVVEYSQVSAPLCGIGMAAYLEKQDDEWVIIWLVMIWIS